MVDPKDGNGNDQAPEQEAGIARSILERMTRLVGGDSQRGERAARLDPGREPQHLARGIVVIGKLARCRLDRPPSPCHRPASRGGRRPRPSLPTRTELALPSSRPRRSATGPRTRARSAGRPIRR